MDPFDSQPAEFLEVIQAKHKQRKHVAEMLAQIGMKRLGSTPWLFIQEFWPEFEALPREAVNHVLAAALHSDDADFCFATFYQPIRDYCAWAGLPDPDGSLTDSPACSLEDWEPSASMRPN